MKKSKLIAGLLTGCLTISLTAMAFADQSKEQVDVYEQQELVKSVVFKVGSNEYFVNGETPGVKMDASPYINQNRTFVPVRYLANALGVPNEKISFDQNTVALNAENAVAKMTIGQKKIITNNISKDIDVAPELKAGRTYLPARFVAESLGYSVDFIDGVVVCWPDGSEKPVEDIEAVNQYLTGQPAQTELPTGTIDEIVAKAAPFDGQPFSFEGWNFAEGWEDGIQYEPMTNKKLDIKIQKVTVDELKQSNGIHVGDKLVIHDVQITNDGVYTTQSSIYHTGLGFMLVEEGNVVRYNYSSNPYMDGTTETFFIDKKYIRGGTYENRLPAPDMSKVTGVLFQYGDKLLYVDVKGGN